MKPEKRKGLLSRTAKLDSNEAALKDN